MLALTIVIIFNLHAVLTSILSAWHVLEVGVCLWNEMSPWIWEVFSELWRVPSSSLMYK